MSTLELENIKHPDNAGNNITLAADGSLGTTTFTGGPVTVNNTSLTLKSQGEVGPFMYRSGGEGNDLRFYASNGTIASPTAKTNGQNVGQIHFHPHDGAGYRQVGSIIAYMAGNATAGNTPVGLKFYTGSTTNNLSMAINENGIVTMPYQPAFKAHVYGSSGAGFSSGSVIPFSATSLNIGSHYNNSNYTFTAPVAGVYVFGGMFRVDVVAGYVHLIPRINGVGSQQVGELPGLSTGNGGFTAAPFVYLRYLAVNDYISFEGHHNAGGTPPINTQTFLYGYLQS